MKAITRARARHRRRLRICDDAHQSHVLKEVVSTRFSLRRNKESVVVVVVVVVLLKKTKNIFLSFSLHPIIYTNHTPIIFTHKTRPVLLLFFFSTCKKKKKSTDRRFFEFALFLTSH
jgi:hypothetical protein